MENELKEGYFFSFVGTNAPEAYKGKFYRVISVESFVYKTGDTTTAEFTASVASGSESGFKLIEVLEPAKEKNHLFYVKWGIKDGMEYQIKIPTGTDRLGLDRDQDVAIIDNTKTPWCDMNPDFAFYLIHDLIPSFNAKNNTPAAGTPQIHFQGEKYHYEEITDPAILQKLRNYESGVTPYIPSKKVTLGGIAKS